jgi:hypothetical protein
LILYSEQFDNAVWTKTDVNVTPNAGTAPDGTTTADLFVPNTNNAFHNIGGFTSNTYSVTAGVEYSNSFYAKANGYRYIQHIWSSGLFSGASYVNIDLQTGTITAGDSANTTVESAGNGWYRIKTVLHCTASGSHYLQFGAIDSGTAARAYAFAANNTDGYLVWGGQSETGVTTDYIATTSAAVSVGPVANLPRLDYSGGATCPKLLLEPQRTNIKTWSEDGTSTKWGNPYQVSVTSNQTTSPDGYANADSVSDTAVTTPHRFEPSFTATSATAYTFSYFAKANTLTECHIYGFTDNFVFSGQTAIFDLSNGTIVSNTGGGTANIESYGSGWYRVSLTLTADASALGYWGFGPAKNDSISYLGDGSSLYMWGIQLEAGAYATSYIPTIAVVTRGQDQAEKASISSLIGATEGTLFVDILFTGAADNNPAYIQTWASQTERLGLFYSNSANLIRPYLVSSGETDFSLGFTPTAGTRYKMAFCYKANDYAFFVNGSQVTIDTKAAVPTAGTKLFVGCLDSAAQANRQFSNINQALLFKTRLTNSQLAELTA